MPEPKGPGVAAGSVVLLVIGFVRAPRALAGMATAIMLGALSAGCTVSTPMPSVVSAAPRGSVAFDSIEGLPEVQFRRLVRSLTQEAETRQLAVVSRTEMAQYRVRGYAAAHIQGKRTTISWVWDIYDADRQRMLRIYGEERGGTSQRGWAVADDATLDRIAKDGMAQLAGFLGSPTGTPLPASIPADEPAVATTEPMQPRTGLTTQAALVDGRR